MRNILELEHLQEKPDFLKLPKTIWDGMDQLPTLADRYKPAFECEAQEEADLYFWQLLVWRVKQDYKKGYLRAWREVVALERQEMAWYALAVDASNVDCCNPGLSPTLAKIKRLYGAVLPFQLRIGEKRLSPKAQAAKDRAARQGREMTDFEAQCEVRKVQRMKAEDAKRELRELLGE